jgi:dipeptidyl aminopeptidase/acylaminoacyl peptidase
LYKWSDARRSDLGLDFLHRWVGTDAVDLAAHSPAQQADKFKIPLLLAHGDVDGVVDIKFAREMNKALKKNKQPSELIVYPYMGHGLLLDAQRSDFYARLLAFLQSNTSPVAASTAVTAPATTH